MKNTEDFVKRIIILLIIAFVIPACDKSSHHDSDTSMRIKPGTLTKFDTPAPTTETNFNTSIGSGGYAIIYTGVINNNNYVGIGMSNNPDAETTNIKIYFQGSISEGGPFLYPSGQIILNGTPQASQDLTLTFVRSTVIKDHGDTNPSNDTTYTIYTISGTGSGGLVITNIKALYVGVN